MTKITAVLTAHREGLIAGPSITSFVDACSYAESAGFEIEGIFVLDRADPVTEQVARQSNIPGVSVYSTDFGDIATSRNFAAAKATGEFVAYLDADDLWSYNWLSEATRYCLAQDSNIVAHSEINILFNDAQNVWVHADSMSQDFDPTYLTVGNYWDAMCLTRTEVFLRYPVIKNELKKGFGYEDWHWNCVTLLAGIPHRPVPGTVHFKRRRVGSLMENSADFDVVPAHSDIFGRARELWLARASKLHVKGGLE